MGEEDTEKGKSYGEGHEGRREKEAERERQIKGRGDIVTETNRQ